MADTVMFVVPAWSAPHFQTLFTDGGIRADGTVVPSRGVSIAAAPPSSPSDTGRVFNVPVGPGGAMPTAMFPRTLRAAHVPVTATWNAAAAAYEPLEWWATHAVPGATIVMYR